MTAEIGAPSTYKRMYDVRMYDVRLREAAMKEHVGGITVSLQIDRLAIYVREGLVTVDEAKIALVEQVLYHRVVKLFQAYWEEWSNAKSFDQRRALMRKWTSGSNEGTPMEEIEKIEEAQPKPKQLYDEPRITTRDRITGAHPSDWAYKR